jgi:peptidoglycan/LPS O-acetylase OafA/YrhL
VEVLSRLSRRTTGGRWIPEIDGLRFVAIALVLADHLTIALNLATDRVVVDGPFGAASASARRDPLFTVFGHGSVGVLVFFMVSGFVLALPLVRNHRAGGQPLPLWPYFRRRITRIEPPYLIVMLLLVPIAWLAGSHVGVGHLVASLFYMHGTYYGTDSPVNSVAWSLEIEVQFYVLVPALAVFLCAGQRGARRARIISIAGLAVACQALGLVTAYTFLGSSIAFFLLGWLLADIYVEDWREAPSSARRWDVVGVAGLLALVVGLAFVSARLQHALAPWLVFVVGYAVFRSVGLRRALSNRWIATIGGMCYSIYLIHYPLFILASGALRPIGDLPAAVALLLGSAVLIPLAIGVGAIFFVCVERPFMDPAWPDRALGRLRPVRRQREHVIVIPEAAVDEVTVG